jgi:hypothetical protein
MTSGNRFIISPTFYEQLLRLQIPNAQKYIQAVNLFLHFWDLHAKKLLEKCW